MTDSARGSGKTLDVWSVLTCSFSENLALTCCPDDPKSSQMSSQSLLKDFGRVASIY
ncbi:hypothetical protein HOLleu_07762 [Holothuria leucospilota]|uniref:Uncharacterized protein n=1 Tax=Holothuria leucospilota TaxID=206669 RepID=A0A9Q1HFU4_HOLLE|nr:hypothetical protein HOLleu_07762 [Holothuria leucospilota]